MPYDDEIEPSFEQIPEDFNRLFLEDRPPMITDFEDQVDLESLAEYDDYEN
jgi:hypothetical protein